MFPKKQKTIFEALAPEKNPLLASFEIDKQLLNKEVKEGMDVQEDTIKNCFVIGIKRRQ